jgi:Cu-Zn family superoxide dismutase
VTRPTLILLAAGLAACGGKTPGPGGQPLPSPSATAELQNPDGKRVGVVTFTNADSGAFLAVSVSGLSPGEHGIHIHQTADCTPPAFTTAGPHLNPAMKQHGLESPEGPHAGDLPNLRVESDGSADTSFRISPDLLAGGDASILGPRGGAVVIHAKPDDQRTDPSGNSGDRVVCGVIRPG